MSEPKNRHERSKARRHAAAPEVAGISAERFALRFGTFFFSRLTTSCLRALVPSCLLLLATGCTVGPDYKKPATAMPAAFASTQPSTQPAIDLSRWWTNFNDPQLTSLIEQAGVSNLDLRQAQERVRQARASRGIAAAGFWPSLDASGSYRRSYTPGAGGAPGRTTSLYQAGLDAAWELDVFGGTRRSVEAAEANIAAAVEDQRSILVSLCAEVALNYIDLRTAQAQVDIAKANLVVQNRSADIARRRFAGGMTSRLDLVNAEAQLYTTQSQIPALESRAMQDVYAIAVLLGREPAAMLALLDKRAAIPPSPPSVPTGLPSELLRRRPDIRRAEARLHAATAQIGVATADLYPKFSLTGSFGTASDKLNGLVNMNNRNWSLGPSISWNLFDGGRIRSNIELQKAISAETLLAYQSSVLTALRDVESSLVACSKEQERRAALTSAVASDRDALVLSQTLYTQGQVEFIEVLNAQRSLYLAEDALAQSTATVSTNIVSLYKALGGGWSETAEPATQPAARPK